jgi:predicted FMN-binding regulatory protein PaiB
LKAIVGIELEVVAITGKAKLSQNRPGVDHDSVRDNFAAGTAYERNVAARMSRDG